MPVELDAVPALNWDGALEDEADEEGEGDDTEVLISFEVEIVLDCCNCEG